jgi:hypothetical protein
MLAASLLDGAAIWRGWLIRLVMLSAILWARVHLLSGIVQRDG